MDRLTLCVSYEPIRVILIYPGALGYFKGSSPDGRNQPQAAHLVLECSHTVRKVSRIWGDVFSPCVLVAFVHVEDVVAERFQMLRFPLSIGQSRSLIQPEIISGPTPPAHQCRGRGSGMMNLSNQRAIGFELVMVIRGQAEEHTL